MGPLAGQRLVLSLGATTRTELGAPEVTGSAEFVLNRRTGWTAQPVRRFPLPAAYSR